MYIITYNQVSHITYDFTLILFDHSLYALLISTISPLSIIIDIYIYSTRNQSYSHVPCSLFHEVITRYKHINTVKHFIYFGSQRSIIINYHIIAAFHYNKY